MTHDDRLRALERRYTETGDELDRLELVRVRCRGGECTPMLTACVPVFAPRVDLPAPFCACESYHAFEDCDPAGGAPVITTHAVHYACCECCGGLITIGACARGGWHLGDDELIKPVDVEHNNCGLRPGVPYRDARAVEGGWPAAIFENPGVWIRFYRPGFEPAPRHG